MELINIIRNKRSQITPSDQSLDYLISLYKVSGRDLELCIVLGAIDYYSGNSRSQNDAFSPKLNHLPTHLKRLNVTTLSKACGIPRETVRRKLDKLIQMGYVEVSKQYLFTHGAATSECDIDPYANKIIEV